MGPPSQMIEMCVVVWGPHIQIAKLKKILRPIFGIGMKKYVQGDEHQEKTKKINDETKLNAYKEIKIDFKEEQFTMEISQRNLKKNKNEHELDSSNVGEILTNRFSLIRILKHT